MKQTLSQSYIRFSIPLLVVVAVVVAVVAIGALQSTRAVYTHNTAAAAQLEGYESSIYTKTLADNIDDPDVWYAHALDLLGKSQFAQADQAVDEYMNLSSDPKGDYLKGLIAGYMNNYDVAVTHLSIARDEIQGYWAPSLDLAWAHYRAGEVDRAAVELSRALEKYPDNAWLLGSYGVVLNAQEDKEKAIEVLGRAGQIAQTLSVEDWQQAYPSNDPDSFESRLEEFKQVVALNLDIAEGRENPLALAQARDFIAVIGGVHPQVGTKHGIVFSACAASRSCSQTSAPNACGQTRTVTGQTQESCLATIGESSDDLRMCFQRCNISRPAPPALPSNYGSRCVSAPNACGKTVSGTIGCTNNCSARTPSNTTCSARVIRGCTNSAASNYNARATVDNGSCQLVPVQLGCTDSGAINYNTLANLDNGTCVYDPIEFGCKNPSAANYTPMAQTSDPSLCLFGPVGCMNPDALNYEPTAVVHNASCQFVNSCPRGYSKVGDNCILATSDLIVPEPQCSLDTDWNDQDNSCNQVFTLQSIKQPIYVRADPRTMTSGSRCSLSNYNWRIMGGVSVSNQIVGNISPTAAFVPPSGQTTTVEFTGDVREKIYERPFTVRGTPSSGCRTAPTFDSLKIKFVNIDITEE